MLTARRTDLAMTCLLMAIEQSRRKSAQQRDGLLPIQSDNAVKH